MVVEVKVKRFEVESLVIEDVAVVVGGGTLSWDGGCGRGGLYIGSDGKQ